MKLFHNVTITVFIKEEEDYDSIKQRFLTFLPFDLEEKKIELTEKKAKTFNDKVITILEIHITKNRLINDMMNYNMEKISDDFKKTLIEQLNSRVDDEGNFFFRIDKKKFTEEGEYELVDHGDCYHFKCHVATYPQDKEKAKEMVKEYLSQ